MAFKRKNYAFEESSSAMKPLVFLKEFGAIDPVYGNLIWPNQKAMIWSTREVLFSAYCAAVFTMRQSEFYPDPSAISKVHRANVLDDTQFVIN